MKSQLIAIVAAVLVVGCGEAQQSATPAEAKPVEPVAEAAQPEPPIYDAVRVGNIEAVKQHLAAGTDVNVKNEDGWTPVHDAAFGSHKEIVQLLIAKGANVNIRNSGGETPLDWAEDKSETADLLRKHGGKTGEELKAEAN